MEIKTTLFYMLVALTEVANGVENRLVLHYIFDIKKFNSTIILTESEIESRVLFLEKHLPWPAKTVSLIGEKVCSFLTVF